MCAELRALVEAKLGQEEWSPEQISRWLAEEYPDRSELRVSHETIYMLRPLSKEKAPCAKSCTTLCALGVPCAGPKDPPPAKGVQRSPTR